MFAVNGPFVNGFKCPLNPLVAFTLECQRGHTSVCYHYGIAEKGQLPVHNCPTLGFYTVPMTITFNLFSFTLPLILSSFLYSFKKWKGII